MTAFERRLPPQPAELPPARAALRAWLHDVGVDGDVATADVLVVTSELLTNGIFHDGGDLITLRADTQDRDVSIEVTTVNHQPGRHPTYRDVEDSAEGGRGLEIVHALSHGYSVVRRDHERVTGCRVATGVDDFPSVAPADTAAQGRVRARTRPETEERSHPCTSE
jgi:anti-sigma regulatory factor (Ser/Thr protein kinase)